MRFFVLGSSEGGSARAQEVSVSWLQLLLRLVQLLALLLRLVVSSSFKLLAGGKGFVSSPMAVVVGASGAVIVNIIIANEMDCDSLVYNGLSCAFGRRGGQPVFDRRGTICFHTARSKFASKPE